MHPIRAAPSHADPLATFHVHFTVAACNNFMETMVECLLISVLRKGSRAWDPGQSEVLQGEGR